MQQGNTHPRPIESRPRRSRDLLVALSSVALGLGFSVAVWLARGAEPAQQYLSGYLIELSLSVDNVFVFALVFRHFAVGPERQRRLLFWGILGAVVLRSAFIAAGIGAITRFACLVPLFGAFILATGTRLALSRSSPRAERSNGSTVRRWTAAMRGAAGHSWCSTTCRRRVGWASFGENARHSWPDPSRSMTGGRCPCR